MAELLRALYCFSEWQEPLIGQFEHPQPHDDCPFFFLLTMPAIILATAATSTAQMMIVAIFS